MSQIERIKQAIMADTQNATYTKRGIEPLFAAPKTARINIIGQAPGIKTQEAGLYWKDKSGDRLRDWLGVDEDTFYMGQLNQLLDILGSVNLKALCNMVLDNHVNPYLEEAGEMLW